LATLGRLRTYNPVILAGLCFIVFAPIEIAAGYYFHNSAIAGNASHDAFDGVAFVILGKIDASLANNPRHEIYCRLRGRFGMVTALLAIFFVGGGLAVVRSNDHTFDQMIAGIVTGIASFLLNGYWERRVEHGHAHETAGFSAHLLGDMVGAVIVAASSIAAYTFADGRWNRGGGFLILAVTSVIAIAKILKILRQIRHSESEHHDHMHDHSTHSH
jgi:Co/Zn/Cd efflux system component